MIISNMYNNKVIIFLLDGVHHHFSSKNMKMLFFHFSNHHFFTTIIFDQSFFQFLNHFSRFKKRMVSLFNFWKTFYHHFGVQCHHFHS